MRYKILNVVKSSIGEHRYMLVRRGLVIFVKNLRNSFGRLIALNSKTNSRAKTIDKTGNVIPEKKAVVPLAVKHVIASREFKSDKYLQKASYIKTPGLSIITLNLNGASLIKSYFEGLKRNANRPLQLIFVDHGSEDKSVAQVIALCNELLIDLDLIEVGYNDTYSASNNRALDLVKYEHTLLLNNDLNITHESRLQVALELLDEQPRIGIIGWNLYHDSAYQHLQHQGISFRWDQEFGFFRPINIAKSFNASNQSNVWEYLAVTAAMALVRTEDLRVIGGFCEGYNYGYEDVDLCLRFLSELGKKSVVIDGCLAVHQESSTQKRQSRVKVASRRLANIDTFRARFGYQLRRLHRQQILAAVRDTRVGKLVLGFVVTESHSEAIAGDYFTALELSLSIKQTIDCEIRFLPQRGPGSSNKYDAQGVDFLIVMIDRFDLSRLKNASPHIVTVAWMRNWFDRWSEWEWFRDYDLYWTSSEKACEFVRSEYSLPSKVVRIATNSNRFSCSPSAMNRDIDICFTGSYWKVKREIEDAIGALKKYNTHFYGHGWDQHSEIKDLHFGVLKYEDIAPIYARSKIVIDDGAVSTKHWASVNSRVFDALASGCLVITNAKEAVSEFLPECDIPTYSSESELDELLEFYLSNEPARVKKCDELRNYILHNHSYDNRATQLVGELNENLSQMFKIAIKVPAPWHKEKHQWGDYHFANSLKVALESFGHSVRVDIMPDWYDECTAGDDVVIVLRGLSEYKPKEDQINLMWNISHPDKILDEECEKFDILYVASTFEAQRREEVLKDKKVLVKALLQCTDTTRFFADVDKGLPGHSYLFVGNSRNVYRDSVKFSIEADIDIAVYGTNWGQFVTDKYLYGENIPNEQLRKDYSGAGVVLNDHWDTMRESGFISNRLFDAVACGATVLSDKVVGIGDDMFGRNVIFYDGKSGFLDALSLAENSQPDPTIVEKIRSDHSFFARAETILADITSIHQSRMGKLQR